MKIRAGKTFFSILSKLILNQSSNLLSQSLNDDFGLRNFDFGFLLSYVNEQLKPGTYEVDWNGSSYASGVYFYTLVTSDYSETKKIILL